MFSTLIMSKMVYIASKKWTIAELLTIKSKNEVALASEGKSKGQQTLNKKGVKNESNYPLLK